MKTLELEELNFEEKRIQPLLIFSCLAIAILLFCRDALSISINKTFFTVIILFTTCFINIPNAIYYMFFLFPLGAGLPSNYFILFFLMKFLINSTLEQENYKISFKKTIAVVCLTIFVLVQNICFKYTGMYHTSLALGYILIYYMTSFQGKPDLRRMLYFSIVAIFIICFIMLFATLKEHSFTDLLDGTLRFAGSAQFGVRENMRLLMDPNYLSFYALSALTSLYILIKKKMPFITTVVFITLVAFSCFVALLALSRAYILSLFVFVLLAMLAGDSNFKGTFRNIFAVVFLVAIAYFAVKSFYPQLLDTIGERFQGDDMATGNGRTTVIAKFWSEFTKTVISFIFGLGIFEINVHCMPLQIIFGLGLMGTIFWIMFYIECINDLNLDVKNKKYYAYIPFLTLLFMSASIPIAQSTVIMFLFVIAMYASKLANQEES